MWFWYRRVIYFYLYRVCGIRMQQDQLQMIRPIDWNTLRISDASTLRYTPLCSQVPSVANGDVFWKTNVLHAVHIPTFLIFFFRNNPRKNQTESILLKLQCQSPVRYLHRVSWIWMQQDRWQVTGAFLEYSLSPTTLKCLLLLTATLVKNQCIMIVFK
jgi:hypothetical protein